MLSGDAADKSVAILSGNVYVLRAVQLLRED